MKFYLTFILLWLAAPVWAAPLRVVVATPPQAFVIRRIGGTLVRVQVLINKGQEPQDFEPTPRQIMNLGQAKILFTTGLPFERRLVGQIKARNHNLLIVDLTSGLPLRTAADGDIDPHIWLSPPLLTIQAATIARTLAAIDPRNSPIYKGNLVVIRKELQKVDRRIRVLLRPYAGRSFYVFHPAFGYFGAAYNLRQQAVEMGGSRPGPRRLARLIKQARADKVRIIFTQPQFDTRSAAVVAAAINGTVVPLNPLAANVLKNFMKIAGALKEALKNDKK
ncbi:MAG: zinc ABC transporter solute-binding protein [Deltaproteobacteria bacterium]|nr:zinc ABC transporter solute-binding protein [Deltaproteobacteria bacterium]